MDALVLKNTEEYEIEAVEADWDHPHPAVLGKIVNKTKKTLCFEFDDNPDNCLLVEPGQLDMLAYDNYVNYPQTKDL